MDPAQVARGCMALPSLSYSSDTSARVRCRTLDGVFCQSPCGSLTIYLSIVHDDACSTLRVLIGASLDYAL